MENLLENLLKLYNDFRRKKRRRERFSTVEKTNQSERMKCFWRAQVTTKGSECNGLFHTAYRNKRENTKLNTSILCIFIQLCIYID